MSSLVLTAEHPVRDTSVPALVLDVGYGGLGVARSLGRIGAPMYATASRAGAPGLASRYWKGTFVWDFSNAPVGESVHFLIQLSRKVGRRAVLIPASDTTAVLVAENAEALAERYIFPAQSPGLVRSLVNKRELYALADRMAVATARTSFPLSRADVQEFLETVDCPILVKGIDPRLPGGTAKAILHTPVEALAYYDRVMGRGGPNVAFQEFIPGDDNAVWMFNGYFDEHSKCLAAFTGRKLRQYPVSVGVTSLGVCIRNEQVEETTRRFLGGIGYRGIVDVDYRFDRRDGLYKILDVNPRLGATFRLFVDQNGLDVARLCYFDATEQPVAAGAPQEGRKWMLEEDVLAGLRGLREGKLSLGSWVRSLRGVQETAWFARDDVTPLVARVWWGLRSAFRPAMPDGGERSHTILGQFKSL